MKRLFCILTALTLFFSILTGCGSMSVSLKESGTLDSQPAASSAPAYSMADGAYEVYEEAETMGEFNTEEYDTLVENRFISVVNAPVSTFSADVDTASYCNVRRMINDGYGIGDIPTGAVRTEEMLNYFTYDYAAPEEGAPFGITAAISGCPWNAENLLLVLGVTTEDLDYEDIGGCNYVFLVDTSGSMDSYDKLELLKESLIGLLDNLRDTDRISIVTYSGSSSVLARGVYGDDRDELKDIINSLGAGGSTNGSAGIMDAYALGGGILYYGRRQPHYHVF